MFKALDDVSLTDVSIEPKNNDSRPTTTWTFACIRKEHSDDETGSKWVSDDHFGDHSGLEEDIVSNKGLLDSPVVSEIPLYSRMAKLNLPEAKIIREMETSNNEKTKGSDSPVSLYPHPSYPG